MRSHAHPRSFVCALTVALAACGGSNGEPTPDAGLAPDAARPGPDATPTQPPPADAAPTPPDAAGPTPDAHLADAGVSDAMRSDAAAPLPDAAPPDAGEPYCGDGLAALAPGPGLALTPAGPRLSCAGFELQLTATADVFAYERLDAGRAPRLKTPALTAPKQDDPQRWRASETHLMACLTGGVVTIVRADCALELRALDGALLYSTRTATDTARVAPGVGPDAGGDVVVRHLEAAVPADAAVYGCGEHTGPLDRAGTRFTHWNTDAYDVAHGGWAPNADPLYASIPFCTLVTANASLGVFVDEPRRTTFDLGATRAGVWAVDTHGTPTTWLMPGATPGEVGAKYRGLTGAAALPPRWAFGFQQSRWGYDTADAVRGVAAEFRARDLPGEVLWLDIQHMDGFRTFTVDPVRFPDPAGLVRDLAALGFRTIAIADPGIKADPAWPVYTEARDARLFLQHSDGTDFVGDVWAGASSFPDFTLSEARDFWAAHVAALAGLGIAGLWLDVNEPTTFPEGGAGLTVPNGVPVRGAAFAEDFPGATMADAHNLYALLEAEATHAGLRTAAPGERPLVVSRAGYAGIQRVAGLWTGDTPSTWPALRQTLPMLLNLGASGVPYVGSDVGGYSGNATPELYARWLQLGVLSPFFRAHVTNGVPGQEPWRFGIEVTDIARFWLAERTRLVPHFEALALSASRTGAPPLRPLAWAYPGEAALRGVEDTALLGETLLVAPVLTEGETTRRVTLPPGRWVEYFSGAVYAGGGVLEQSVRLAALPMYLGEGALLLRAATTATHSDALPAALRLDVVPGPRPTSLRLPAPGLVDPADDEHLLAFEQRFDGTTLQVTLAAGAAIAPPPVEVAVRLLDAAPAAPTDVRWNGAAVPAESVRADLDDRTLHVTLPPGEVGTLAIDLTARLPAPDDLVEVDLVVEVPEGTPGDQPIHIAGTFNDWIQTPLDWLEPGRRARGRLRVPRGQWYEYKFTRGDWDTVEKWPDCAEASNRYAFGAATQARADRVWTWRDACP